MRRNKHYGLALICGILATAALPPIYLIFLLIPAYSGLYLLLRKAITKRVAFFIGWWFGLGYFTTGLYWFAYALLVEPEKFAWMIPFAVLGLPSILAIYYGLATLAWKAISQRIALPPIVSIILFSAIWLIFEWLRGHLFTGFPWNLAAYSWGLSNAMVQWASVIGAYGYSGWTIVLSTLPAIWYITPNERQRVVALSITLLMLSIPFTYGIWRLNAHPTQFTKQTIHVVQGNIAQQHKWDPEKQFETVQTYVELTQNPDLPDDAVIIWPETAYPYFLEANTPPVNFIAKALPENGVLLTGAMHAEWNANKMGIKHFYNGVHAVRPNGTVEAVYNKSRLVPFGEYVPFRGYLPVEKITHGMQDFMAGEGATRMSIKGVAPFQPLICYEVIFPDYTLASNQNSEWLLNTTNDAWFGVSTGPYQHLQMARFRAVEQGVPMVRAANTGISAVFDAYGRELKRLPLNKRGSFTLKLPVTAK